jgi:hypothetical protein
MFQNILSANKFFNQTWMFSPTNFAANFRKLNRQILNVYHVEMCVDKQNFQGKKSANFVMPQL